MRPDAHHLSISPRRRRYRPACQTLNRQPFNGAINGQAQIVDVEAEVVCPGTPFAGRLGTRCCLLYQAPQLA